MREVSTDTTKCGTRNQHALQIDAHTHVFCWGENPVDGFLSERTRRSWVTRLVVWLTGLRHVRLVRSPGLLSPLHRHDASARQPVR